MNVRLGMARNIGGLLCIFTDEDVSLYFLLELNGMAQKERKNRVQKTQLELLAANHSSSIKLLFVIYH